MTPQQLALCTGASLSTAALWLPELTAAMQRFQIDSPKRQAAFLSQIGVESANLTALREDLDYSAQGLLDTWPLHFTPEQAQEWGRTKAHPANEQMIANYAYANRMGNGPPESGDGFRFAGRGVIQLTGRANYRQLGTALGLTLEQHPEDAAQPHAASLIAGYYWFQHGCNRMADAELITAITQAINGGQNGLQARLDLFGKALVALTP